MTQKSSGPRSKGKIDNQIAYAFQGGGAYQAGVYEALAECDCQADWGRPVQIRIGNSGS
jgi:predicted acylesterase/phospholipase RssA